MKGYLGEFEVYGDLEKYEIAMLYISKYSTIDGAHHKQWLIDQIARVMLGTPVKLREARWSNGKTEIRFSTQTPSQEYLNWIGEDINNDEYIGIAP